VTGASEGIGEAFAEELAAKGLNLVLVARRHERLTALAKNLESRFQIEVRISKSDFSNQLEVNNFLKSTQALDVGLLVAAAGFGSSGPALQSDALQEAELVTVNCIAVLLQTLHFGQRFRARKSGGLILFGSLLGFQGTPYSANYAASKAYIQSLAEGIGEELKGSGVEVLAVAPGPIATGFAKRANMNLGRTLSPDIVAKASLKALGKQRTVRPGWLSKLLGWGLATAPRLLRVRIIGEIMKGMTEHPTDGRQTQGSHNQSNNG
jgi:short-subunit dehydrogenase